MVNFLNKNDNSLKQFNFLFIFNIIARLLSNVLFYKNDISDIVNFAKSYHPITFTTITNE